MPKRFDQLLFETNDDSELAKIYQCSRQYINYIRNIYYSHTNSVNITIAKKTKEIDDKILNYIKMNPNNISIKEFKMLNNLTVGGRSRKTTGRKTQFIDIARFKRIAYTNGITIKFRIDRYNETEHGVCCKRKKCPCIIGKLADALRERSQKFKHTISREVINKIANDSDYILEYEKLRSDNVKKNLPKLGDFYERIFDEIKKSQESTLMLSNSLYPLMF